MLFGVTWPVVRPKQKQFCAGSTSQVPGAHANVTEDLGATRSQSFAQASAEGSNVTLPSVLSTLSGQSTVPRVLGSVFTSEGSHYTRGVSISGNQLEPFSEKGMATLRSQETELELSPRMSDQRNSSHVRLSDIVQSNKPNAATIKFTGVWFVFIN